MRRTTAHCALLLAIGLGGASAGACFSSSSGGPQPEGDGGTPDSTLPGNDGGAAEASPDANFDAGDLDVALDDLTVDAPSVNEASTDATVDVSTHETGADDAGADVTAAETGSVDGGADAASDATGSADAGAEAALDAGSPVDASSCSVPDDGGVCNTFPNIGSVITVSCGSAPPSPSGGTILDGTYVATAGVFYGGACAGDAGPSVNIGPQTLMLTGDCFQSIFVNGGGTVVNTTSTCSAQGTSYTCTRLCPADDAGMITNPYTATSTTLTVYQVTMGQPNYVTYTKQ